MNNGRWCVVLQALSKYLNLIEISCMMGMYLACKSKNIPKINCNSKKTFFSRLIYLCGIDRWAEEKMLFWLLSFEGWWRVIRPAPDTTVNTFNSRARCRQRPLIRTAVVYIPGENYRTYPQKTVMTNLMYINWIFKYGNNSLCVLQIFQWLFWLMKVLFCSVTICHVCN